MDVIRDNVDTRQFPMEIAKKMLALGDDLSMNSGPTAYFKSEMVLVNLLEVLTTYHIVMWPERLDCSYVKQQAFVTRFITVKRYSPNLKASNARQLLDSIHYFPTTREDNEPAYLDTLTDEEMNDACTQNN